MNKLAAVSLAALAAATTAFFATSAGAHAGGRDLSLTAKEVDSSQADLGDKGESSGDQMTFSDDLYNDQGHKVGHDAGVCVTTRVHKADSDLLCSVGFELTGGDRGKITASGLVTSKEFESGRLELPITGGTGDFDSATGHVAATFTNPQDGADLTFHLG